MKEKFQKLYSLLDNSQFDISDFVSADQQELDKTQKINITEILKNKLHCSDISNLHFLTGHKGCGKTSELLKLKSNLEQEKYIVFYVPLANHININDIHYVDVLLAFIKCISEELIRKEVYINYTSLGSVNLSDLKDMIPIKSLSFELKFASIADYIKHSEYLREKTRDLFDKQAYNLINSINEVLKKVSTAIENTEYKDIIVIFDDLDKCPNPTKGEKDSFYHLINNSLGFFSDIESKTLLTLPIDRYFEFSNQYQVMFMPNLDVDPENKSKTHKILYELFHNKLESSEQINDENLFDEGVIEKILELSTGNYGQFIDLIKECCIFENNETISINTVDKAAKYLRNQLLRKVSLKTLEKLEELINTAKKLNVSKYSRLLANNVVFYNPDKPEQLMINPLFILNNH